MIYQGNFTCKEDVINEFHINDWDDNNIIILAAYHQDGYEGYAEVIFINSGKFYSVHGSHCSCFGLENQFDPIEVSPKAISKIIKDGYAFSQYDTSYVQEIIKQAKSLSQDEFLAYLLLHR